MEGLSPRPAKRTWADKRGLLVPLFPVEDAKSLVTSLLRSGFARIRLPVRYEGEPNMPPNWASSECRNQSDTDQSLTVIRFFPDRFWRILARNL